jgi:hypothetical protein
MASKRTSVGTKTPRRKPAVAETPTLTDEVAMSVLESSPGSGAASGIDPGQRRELVAAEAYYLAERRGFAPGHEVEDWVTAEALVDSRLYKKQGRMS